MSTALRNVLVVMTLVLVPGHSAQGARSYPPTNPDAYRGPVSLGPFHIDNKRGATPVSVIWSAIGRPALPSTFYFCYRDPATGVFLGVNRGADDASLARGITLSSFPSCVHQPINPATGFAEWRTEKGITLGSSEDDVRRAYGQPTSIVNARTDPGAYFPGLERIDDPAKLFTELPLGDVVLLYRPTGNQPDLSAANVGIRGGKVAWLSISDNE